MVKSVLMNLAQVLAAIFLFKPLGDLGVIVLGVSSGVLDELLTGFAILLPVLLWAGKTTRGPVLLAVHLTQALWEPPPLLKIFPIPQ